MLSETSRVSVSSRDFGSSGKEISLMCAKKFSNVLRLISESSRVYGVIRDNSGS